MGRVIPFSEIETYIASISGTDIQKGAVLDTNILISASYDVRDSYQEVVNLWEILLDAGCRLFVTFNTRSEYLEFQRRLILSENLIDLTDEFSKIRIPRDAKAKIQTCVAVCDRVLLLILKRMKFITKHSSRKLRRSYPRVPTLARQVGCKFVIFLQNQIELADQDLVLRASGETIGFYSIIGGIRH